MRMALQHATLCTLHRMCLNIMQYRMLGDLREALPDVPFMVRMLASMLVIQRITLRGENGFSTPTTALSS